MWLGLAGVAALVPALRTLLPRGTFTARPGLPATVLARGLLAGAFFGVEAYVPLTLSAVHGFSPALSGLTTLGFALAGVALIGPDWGLAWLVLPFWLVAGASMGLAYPSISVLGLDYAAPRDRGFVSSALQVNDMTFAAIMVGLGGVMLVTFASTADPTAAVVPLNLLLAGVALLGALLLRPAGTDS